MSRRAKYASVLCLLILLGGCTIRNRYHPEGPHARPLTAYGVSHVLITVPVVVLAGSTTGRPMWGALGACAFFLGHETEETRNWSYFEWGKKDSVADVVLPCLAGFGMAKLLEHQSWWRLGRERPPASARTPR